MSTVTFKGLDDFAKRAPGLLRRGSKAMGTELAEVTLAALARKAIDLTPVGPSEEAARRAALHGPAYGHMRARWFKVVGSSGGQSGAKLPARSNVQLRAGQGAKLVNDAAHARVIDRGRRRSGQIPKRGSSRAEHTRMIGSNRAKNGITKPLRAWGFAKRESLTKLAVRRAEAKIR